MVAGFGKKNMMFHDGGLDLWIREKNLGFPASKVNGELD
jgi:hypothetical protein